MEACFRSSNRPQEVRQATIALGLVIAATLPFIPSDYRAAGWSRLFWLFLAMRITWMLLSGAVLALFRRGVPAPLMDRILTAWCLICGLGCLFIGYTRPAIFLVGCFLAGITLMLMLFFVLPLPFDLQITVCVLGLLVDTYLLVLRQADLDPVSQRAIVVNCLLANFVGAMGSWHVHRLRRREFTALQREIGLRSGLQEALSQVRTLQGCLPICMHCKSVRDDKGYWQQVEVYVREHSMAEFTHGICPKCVHEHFGESLAATAT